jgi:hypothetical protein
MTIFVKDDDRRIENIKGAIAENIYYEIHALLFIELNDAKAFLDNLIAIDLYSFRKEEL